MASSLWERFIAREDVKAIQHSDGSYAPVHEPWTLDDIEAHLAGRVTYGHYLLNQASEAKLFAFDIDLDKVGVHEGRQFNPRELWQQGPSPYRELLERELKTMGMALACRTARLLDIPTAVAYSGSKGVHVYCFTGLMPAAEIREQATWVLNGALRSHQGAISWKHPKSFKHLTVELFPKQDRLTDSRNFGNLLRLPLGVNRKTGKEGFFVRCKDEMGKWQRDDVEKTLQFGSIR